MFGLYEKSYKLLMEYFFSKKEIDEVRIYGSRAMGTERPGSDVDFAIFTNVDRNMMGEIKADLEELQTPYLYDVTDMKFLSYLPMRGHIERVGKVFYRRDR